MLFTIGTPNRWMSTMRHLDISVLEGYMQSYYICLWTDRYAVHVETYHGGCPQQPQKIVSFQTSFEYIFTLPVPAISN